MSKPHLLLVEDERAIREPLGEFLSRSGYRVSAVADAAAARETLASRPIDCVICDIMMPGEDGLGLTRHIRETSEIPVILLTARAEETDRIVGLEMGADDYVVKPFSPRELAARIKVILRRAGGKDGRQIAADRQRYRFADWTLDAAERVLIDGEGVRVALSTGEFRLLLALVTHPRQVLSRDRLLDLTQGREAAPFDRAIDNQISRLRKKVESDSRHPELIKTVWGGGYVFAAEVRKA